MYSYGGFRKPTKSFTIQTEFVSSFMNDPQGKNTDKIIHEQNLQNVKQLLEKASIRNTVVSTSDYVLPQNLEIIDDMDHKINPRQ